MDHQGKVEIYIHLCTLYMARRDRLLRVHTLNKGSSLEATNDHDIKSF